MSYILEALKKAQAERQLGSAPDIHAPAPVHVPAAAKHASRKPLLAGLAAGIALAGVAGVLAWRAQAPAPLAVLAATAPAPGQAAPATAAVPAPALPAPALPAPALPAPPVAGAAPVAVAPAAEAPVPAAPARHASHAAPAREALAAAPAAAPALPPAVEPAPPRKPAQPESTAASATRTPAAPASSPAAGNAPQAVYLPAPAATRAPDPAPSARAPEPVEDNLRTLQQLPEALQREVPRVSVGGYIYSPNPADRLLLVDKMLRREGEELAPGLVLERLMPKYAVMNYRGTRYRVAY